MSLSVDPLNSLGFHYTDNCYSDEDRTEIIVHNVANVVGYFPVIGTIAGLARMIFALYQIISSETLEDAQKEYYRAEIYRGAVEFLWLGIGFIVPDIIVTRARNISPKFFI